MIVLDITPPDEALTANQRLHFRRKAEITRNWRLRTAILARKTKPIPHAHVTCVIRFPDRRRRDVSNWAPTSKVILDGIVDAGVLIDDSDTYVVGPDMRTGPVSRDGLRITFRLDPDCGCADCVERFTTGASA